MINQNSHNKIILIGLDGATFDLIKPWAESGKCPTFARLLAEGASAPLRSTMPPVTPLAWSSLIHGTNPGTHGIFGFLKRRSGTYDWYPITAAERVGLPFWDWAGQNNRQVGVYNMPMTYPPQPIPNGYMISGMGVPDIDVRFTTPSELQEELLAQFTPEQLVEQPIGLFNQESYLDYLLQSVDDNLAITCQLLDINPTTDLLCTVFIATDRVQHFYWQQMLDQSSPPNQKKAIAAVYRKIDDALAFLLEKYPAHTFMIISDHGAGLYNHLVNINQWLAENDWLVWSDNNNEAADNPIPYWKSLYRSVGRTVPTRLRRRLKALLPAPTLAQIRTQMAHWSPSIDWSKTSAYSASFGGNIYLNQVNREPHGIVQPGEKAESLLAEIASSLLELRDPDSSEKIVNVVHYGRDIYEGVFTPEAPDLVVEWNKGYYSMAGLANDNSNVFQGRLQWPDSHAIHSAEHHLHGILIAYGPEIRGDTQLDEANIMDVAPTLLHLLDLPVPSSMQGVVLEEIFEPETLPRPKYVEVDEQQFTRTQTGYSLAEEEAIMSQLKDLGYLD